MYILSTNCLRFNSASKREQRRVYSISAEREQNRRSQWLKSFSTFHLNKQLVYLSTCQLVYLSTRQPLLQRIHIIINMERSITLVCKYFVAYITQALSNFWQINTILEF